MNELPKTPDDFDELASLVKTSFPDIRCLRCGHDEFYLTDRAAFFDDYNLSLFQPGFPVSEPAGRGSPVLTLGCTRCGHLEHHLKAVLAKSKVAIERKPS